MVKAMNRETIIKTMTSDAVEYFIVHNIALNLNGVSLIFLKNIKSTS